MPDLASHMNDIEEVLKQMGFTKPHKVCLHYGPIPGGLEHPWTASVQVSSGNQVWTRWSTHREQSFDTPEFALYVLKLIIVATAKEDVGFHQEQADKLRAFLETFEEKEQPEGKCVSTYTLTVDDDSEYKRSP